MTRRWWIVLALVVVVGAVAVARQIGWIDDGGPPSVTTIDNCREAALYFEEWIREPTADLSLSFEERAAVSRRAQRFEEWVAGLGGCPNVG